MKILHVALLTPGPESRSGAGVVIHGQVRAVRDAHELTLVLLAPASRSQARAQQRLREEGIDVHVLRGGLPTAVVGAKRALQDAVGRRRGWPAMGSPGAVDPALIGLVNRLIARGGYDLMQVENLGLSRLPTDRRLPTLVVEHEVRDAGPVGDWQAGVWEQADLVQVFTQRDADAIRKRAPGAAERIRVNPFGIDLPDASAIDQDGGRHRKTLLFVGNFRHRPNIDAALWLCRDIVPRVAGVVDGLGVRIVGQDPPAQVRALASSVVEVTGRVAAVEPELAGAAVVAVPVREGGGMRVKTLQAMAAGRAVVTTRLGAEGLLGDERGWPVRIADEADAFAAEVVRFMQEPESAVQLGAQARRFVEQHHGWSAYRDRLESSYRELVARAGGGAR